MPIILKVTLVKNDEGVPLVDVNEEDNASRIELSDSDQHIFWRLSGNAEEGNFHALDNATEPGFAWKDPPPNGIFGRPRLMENGDLRVGVRHKNAHSLGTFVYQIWVQVGKKDYSTELKGAKTATNPAIINK